MNNHFIKRTWCFLNRHFNFKMGSIAGILTGSIVFFININSGFVAAFASFLKQFAFNVIMAGFNTRTCQKIATRIKTKWIGLISASFIPTTQAFIVLFCTHYFGATPKPGASTIWQVIPNIIIFFMLALIYRGDISLKSHTIFQLTTFVRFKLNIKGRKIRRLDYNKQAS